MPSSNSNNTNKFNSHSKRLHIAIAIGCTRAVSGPCNLKLIQTRSSKVACINDGSCQSDGDLLEYYYCNTHDVVMCCNCAKREQKVETHEHQKDNKYNDDEYVPEDGEIVEMDIDHNKPLKRNRKRKLETSSNEYKPPNKKMKTNNHNTNLEDMSFKALKQMIIDQQDEINQLKESNQTQIKKYNKLSKTLKDKKNTITKLEKQVNDKTTQIDRITNVFKKNKSEIISEKNNLKNKFDALENQFKNMELQFKKEIAKLQMDNERLDKEHKEYVNERKHLANEYKKFQIQANKYFG